MTNEGTKMKVTTTTFEYAKVGDRVYSWRFGWGVIANIIRYNRFFPLEVKFTEERTESYTIEGRWREEDINPDLFHDEVMFLSPTKTYDLTPPEPTHRPFELKDLPYGAWFKFKQGHDNRQSYFRLEHVRLVDAITEVKLGGVYSTTDQLLALWLYSYDPAGGDWLPCGVEVKK